MAEYNACSGKERKVILGFACELCLVEYTMERSYKQIEFGSRANDISPRASRGSCLI